MVWTIKRLLTKNEDDGDFRCHHSLKRHVIRERGNECAWCGGHFLDIILDHKIPICLGGEQYDLMNVQLLCKSCNNSKTKFDKLIINVCKKMGFIESVCFNCYAWDVYISKEDLISFYLTVFDLLFKLNETFNVKNVKM